MSAVLGWGEVEEEGKLAFYDMVLKRTNKFV